MSSVAKRKYLIFQISVRISSSEKKEEKVRKLHRVLTETEMCISRIFFERFVEERKYPIEKHSCPVSESMVDNVTTEHNIQPENANNGMSE